MLQSTACRAGRAVRSDVATADTALRMTCVRQATLACATSSRSAASRTGIGIRSGHLTRTRAQPELPAAGGGAPTAARSAGERPVSPQPMYGGDSGALDGEVRVIGFGQRGMSATTRLMGNVSMQGAQAWVLDTDAKVLTGCGDAKTLRVRTDNDAQLSATELASLAGEAAVAAAAAAPSQRPGSPVPTCGVAFLVGSAGAIPGGSTLLLQVAAYLRRTGYFVAAALTRPFEFEGRRKLEEADALIEALQDVAQLVVVVPQGVLTRASAELTINEASAIADNTLEVSCRAVLWALGAPEVLRASGGTMMWHGRDLRQYRRLLSPPLEVLLTCPGAGGLGRGLASLPLAALAEAGLASGLSTLAEDAVAAAVESPFLESAMASASGVLCVLSLPARVLSHELDMAPGALNDPEKYAIRAAVQVAAMTVAELAGSACQEVVVCAHVRQDWPHTDPSLLCLEATLLVLEDPAAAEQQAAGAAAPTGGSTVFPALMMMPPPALQQQQQLQAGVRQGSASSAGPILNGGRTAARGSSSSSSSNNSTQPGTARRGGQGSTPPTAPPAAGAAAAAGASSGNRSAWSAMSAIAGGSAAAAVGAYKQPDRQPQQQQQQQQPPAQQGMQRGGRPPWRTVPGPGAAAAAGGGGGGGSTANTPPVSRAQGAATVGTGTGAEATAAGRSPAGSQPPSPLWGQAEQQQQQAPPPPMRATTGRAPQPPGLISSSQQQAGPASAGSAELGGIDWVPRMADKHVDTLVAQSLDLPPSAARWRHHQRRATAQQQPRRASSHFPLPAVWSGADSAARGPDAARDDDQAGMVEGFVGGRHDTAEAEDAGMEPPRDVRSRVAGMLQQERRGDWGGSYDDDDDDNDHDNNSAWEEGKQNRPSAR